MTLVGQLGARIGRHAAVYGAGTAVSVLVSLATVAVFTRYLVPAEFGDYALFLVLASVLTVLYNLGSLQGSYMWVYGAAGEDAGDEQDEEAAGDKREAMGTGLVLTALLSLAGTAVVAAFARDVADVLTGDRGDSAAIIVAASAGALGSVWRLLSHIPRMERRPGMFVVLMNMRRVLVLAIGVILVASGYGALGAVVGVATGTAVSVLVGLIVLRRSLRLTFRPADAVMIIRRGVRFVPVVAALALIQTGDVFVVSRYASGADTGIYRVATGIGAVMSYGVSAFLMAWGPFERTPAFAAIDQQRGAEGIRALILSYFVVVAVGALVAFTVLADLLVRVAGESYSDAAELIPFAGLSFLLSGAIIVVFRSVRFARRQRAYQQLAVTAAGIFVAASVVLVPAIGPVGALVASATGYATAITGLLVLSQRGPLPISVDGRRLLACVALGAACLLLGLPVVAGELSGITGPLGLVAYPVLLVATGLVDRRQLLALGRVVRLAVLPRGPREMRERVARLGPEDRNPLRRLAREGWSAAAVASATGRTEAEVLEELVRLLRELGRLAPPGSHDARIGAYLTSSRSVAERERQARRLYETGVDPVDLDAVETTFAAVRQIRTTRRREEPLVDDALSP
jgi:O-antigen/teichoic acid export membrane protein